MNHQLSIVNFQIQVFFTIFITITAVNFISTIEVLKKAPKKALMYLFREL